MDSIAMEARTKNVALAHGKPRDRCRFCADTGYVVAVLRRETVREYFRGVEPRVKVCCAGLATEIREVGTADYEEMGPCPFCERGFYEEFGDAENQTKSPPVRPPWNMKEGFWKGRSLVEIVPLEPGSSRPSGGVENAARAREVSARLAGVGLPMPE